MSFFSCKKKAFDDVYKISDNKSLEELFSLKNYKTQKKNKINDSVLHILATNGAFFLEGDFNTKFSEKTGFWTLTNKNDSKKIEIDYIVFAKNDVHKNQIIFSNNGIIDSVNSKFYNLFWKSENGKRTLYLNFYSPRNESELFASASIRYFIGRDKKKIIEDSFVLKNGDGIYREKVDYDFKKGDKISGYFSEFVNIKKETKDSVFIGNNTIYFHKKVE